MPIGRRLSTLLLVLALVGAPALVLRVFCVGNSCDAGGTEAQASVPFCPLPRELRRRDRGRVPRGALSRRDGRDLRPRHGLDRGPERRAGRLAGLGHIRHGARSSSGHARADRVPRWRGEPGNVARRLRLDAIAPTLETITGSRGTIPRCAPARRSTAWRTTARVRHHSSWSSRGRASARPTSRPSPTPGRSCAVPCAKARGTARGRDRVVADGPSSHADDDRHGRAAVGTRHHRHDGSRGRR